MSAPAWLQHAVDAVLEASLLARWIVPVCTVVAALVVLALWWRRTRRRPWWAQAGILAAAVLVGAGADLWVNRVWMPVADGVGTLVFVWVGVLALVLLQVAFGAWRPRPVRRALLGLAAVLTATVCAMMAVNAHYATYRSLAIVLGTHVHTVPWAEADTRPRETTVPLARWTPSDGAPSEGQLTTVPVPASDPGFHPRDAVVYLPPAYRDEVRPLLPVLVLMAGVPGSPADWPGPGDLGATMEAFAREHGGAAPIVVVVDPLGGASLTNPLCSDGSAGAAATYVEQDVPAWIEQTLQVDPDRSHWAVGGVSNGGTCALQTVTRSPDSYGTFLAMSAELHPTLGTEARSVAVVFGGNRDAYLENDPLTLLGRSAEAKDGRYARIGGVFSVGRGDSYVGGPVSGELADAARAAGMDVELRTYPGGHTWSVWSHALADQLPWAAPRMGLGVR